MAYKKPCWPSDNVEGQGTLQYPNFVGFLGELCRRGRADRDGFGIETIRPPPKVVFPSTTLLKIRDGHFGEFLSPDSSSNMTVSGH